MIESTKIKKTNFTRLFLHLLKHVEVGQRKMLQDLPYDWNMMVTKNQSKAPNPFSSALTSRSINQMTNPMKMCVAAIINHICFVKALKNIHVSFCSTGFWVTTMSRPDSIYGCEKSTKWYLFANIDVSPTAASNVYSRNKSLDLY